ncbi:MAG: hypothetical protein ABF301_01810 [Sulfurovum sp.]
MKFFITSILLISALIANDDYEIPQEFDKQTYEIGQDIFEQKCTTCHVKFIDMNTVVRNFFHENNNMNLKAPTANQISFRLKQQIGDKSDIEFHLFETNDYLKSYVLDPNRSKTICLDGVIEYFDGMPSMRGIVSEEEIEQLNHFLYFLEGFNGINEHFHDETIF